jgi:hypothetical protein
MDTLVFRNLDLRAPFEYTKIALADPFVFPAAPEGAVLFQLDSHLYTELEGDPHRLLGKPIQGGVESPSEEGNNPGKGSFRIPPGKYFFVQCREPPSLEAVAQVNAEAQREALWRGLHITDRLYVRFLVEEEGLVFQILRPLVQGGE